MKCNSRKTGKAGSVFHWCEVLPTSIEQLLTGSFLMVVCGKFWQTFAAGEKPWKLQYQNHARKVCHTNVQTTHVETTLTSARIYKETPKRARKTIRNFPQN